MTRKLSLVIVGVVVATLLLAGGGTLALATVRARQATVSELRDQAIEIAANINGILEVDPGDTAVTEAQQLRNRLRVLKTLKSVLSIDEITVMIADRNGNLPTDDLPDGLTIDQLQPEQLASGLTVADNSGKLAYAAAPATGPGGRLYVVVVTRTIAAGLGDALRLFVWAAIATILLGLLAAYLLGNRLTKPIREASLATQRIAAGELGTRLHEPTVRHHDELAELSRSINGMASSLERARVLEQQFLLSVSHDLRTPLTSIKGYADAIDDGKVDPRRAATVIRTESRRLERLVADLLDLAKLQSRSFSLRMVTLDLSAAVHTATDAAAATMPQISFHPVTTGPLIVLGDPDRIAQVLANLVENAAKYARRTVLVSARATESWATVTVDDDGPGIAAADLPHVFERLYVARHQPERTESASGLGLAIVRELVNAMGGSVEAGAAPAGGARFSLQLPLAG
ncbi:MAG: HAMP domain-containing histidine kinase [Actinobacteria bacterium]|nr:HAMP domain-containing histidine kinase [Actinomycetota bacterium]